MTHCCHAQGCTTEVPRQMFMCRGHWFTLPWTLRRQILSTYSPGQELRRDPSPEYLEVAQQCVEYLSRRDSR